VRLLFILNLRHWFGS